MAVNPQTDRLNVRPVKGDDELRLAEQLMAAAHPSAFPDPLRWLRACGRGYPGYRREHTRVAWCNGEPVGALRLNTEILRLGEARLKTGVLSWISLLPTQRRRGVRQALVEDALQYLTRQGYHAVVLFGDATFLSRYGFTGVFEEAAIDLDAATVRTRLPRGVRLRAARPGDIPAIQRLHQSNESDAACALLRTAAHLTNKWQRWSGLQVLTDTQGRIMAYFSAALGGGRLLVAEVGVAGDRGACAALLAGCAKTAEKGDAPRLRFMLSALHPFAEFLRGVPGVESVANPCGSVGAMALVDVAEAFESMIPEWESLLGKDAMRTERGEVTLFVEQRYYRIRAYHGAVDIAQGIGANKLSVPLCDLVRLLAGVLPPEDIGTGRTGLVTAQGKALLRVLFPRRSPYIWWFDRF